MSAAEGKTPMILERNAKNERERERERSWLNELLEVCKSGSFRGSRVSCLQPKVKAAAG